MVIHPGSLNLRIGRASDTFPVTLPQCVARRKRDSTAPEVSSPWMLRPESKVSTMTWIERVKSTLVQHSIIGNQH